MRRIAYTTKIIPINRSKPQYQIHIRTTSQKQSNFWRKKKDINQGYHPILWIPVLAQLHLYLDQWEISKMVSRTARIKHALIRLTTLVLSEYTGIAAQVTTFYAMVCVDRQHSRCCWVAMWWSIRMANVAGPSPVVFVVCHFSVGPRSSNRDLATEFVGVDVWCFSWRKNGWQRASRDWDI